MTLIEFTVDDSEYVEWAETTLAKFPTMINTMQNVAEMIDLNTRPYVPLDTGLLERSFKYVMVEQSSDFLEMEMGYDAVDPKSGFAYAEYQHETTGLHHPRRGEPFYLFKGIKSSLGDAFDMIEKDYLSLFGGR